MKILPSLLWTSIGSTVFAILLSMTISCSESTEFFESLVPDGAKENYIDSGATGVHYFDVNAIRPVTITPSVLGTNFAYPLPQGCTMTWDVQQIDPIDYEYWLAEPTTITYDADLFRCNVRFSCRYEGDIAPATLNGNIYDVPVTCTVSP